MGITARVGMKVAMKNGADGEIIEVTRDSRDLKVQGDDGQVYTVDIGDVQLMMTKKDRKKLRDTIKSIESQAASAVAATLIQTLKATMVETDGNTIMFSHDGKDFTMSVNLD